MLNENLRMKVRTPAMIRAMEEHFMAFDNVALAGPNYRSFASPDDQVIFSIHEFTAGLFSVMIYMKKVSNLEVVIMKTLYYH